MALLPQIWLCCQCPKVPIAGDRVHQAHLDYVSRLCVAAAAGEGVFTRRHEPV